MKKLLFLLLLFYSITANSTVYNVAATGGDFSTITQVNAATFVAGDQILFNRGETFTGTLIINQSGTSGNPITFGAYGTGANPIITGFTTVSAWTDLGSNIWESTNAVSTLSTLKMVTINGVNTPMGRTPNSGYYNIDSRVTNTSITSSSIITDWTGAEVVIKKRRWIIDRNLITSSSGTTINYTSASSYAPSNNWGFFIQNDSRTLDIQNEWYYNPSTKKLRIYSTSQPANVKVSTITNLVSCEYVDFITVQNIDFVGANNAAINLSSTKNLTVQNCTISFSGVYGIVGTSGTNGLPATAANCLFTGNTIDNINNNSIELSTEYGTATISYNTITNNGLFEGMGVSDDGQNMGIHTLATGTTINNNVLQNMGYAGIEFDGANVTVINNFVDNFCLIKDDGGGIYTSNNSTGKVITGNIVINGIGNHDGADYDAAYDWRQTSAANGIYLDNYSNAVTVSNNTVANCGQSGIFCHNATDFTITGNKVYNCGESIYWGAGLEILDDGAQYTTGVTVTGNQFISKTAVQNVISFVTNHADIESWGTIDNNYYARPIADTNPIKIASANYTLAAWQSMSIHDDNSHKSPQAITSESDLQFEYNATTSPVTVNLSLPMIDMGGTKYATIVTLQPYTSAVLIPDNNPDLPPRPIMKNGKYHRSSIGEIIMTK